jgi:type IV secretion system protein VirB9
MMALCHLLSSAHAYAQPVVADSRVKTLVYNPNDVYALLMHYGYQAHVEFSPKEAIQTISLGDKSAWQVISNGRRLFIRPLVGGAKTNMTVITNIRSYLFDIQSSKGTELPRREDLVYMVRFYYPDDHIQKTATMDELPPIYPDQLASLAQAQAGASSTNLPALNFNYTFTGDPKDAPAKVFDDGRATYFKLKTAGKVFVVNPQQQEVPAQTTPTSDGFLKVNVVTPIFVIKYESGAVVKVFNEKMNGGAL